MLYIPRIVYNNTITTVMIDERLYHIVTQTMTVR